MCEINQVTSGKQIRNNLHKRQFSLPEYFHLENKLGVFAAALDEDSAT